ncbi:MAG: hypothetical protein ABI700_12705 [Chloroflexota bacterium]
MLKHSLIIALVLIIGVNLVSAQDSTDSANCESAILPSGIVITAEDLSAPATNPGSAMIMNDIGINPQVLLNVAANFGDIPSAYADFANPDTKINARQNAVVTRAGNSLKMYEGECTESAVVATLTTGTSVLVMEGPYASEGLAWWHVQRKGLIGWVIEGQGDSIWLSGA